jgi:peptidoglycan/LPS O-acetylase OafA/YrhL
MYGAAEPSQSSSPRGINLEIEYLRAVAVLMVVLAHADDMFPRSGIGQWTGVDLFFCISGYVISRAFEPFFDTHIAEGRWWAAARAFWTRRVFRLAPSAWLWLGVMVFCSWAFNQSGKFGTFSESLKTAAYFLTFTTNLMLPTGAVTTNGFFWSLTLEDQFYFMFPFFLLLVRGHWRWIAFLLLIYLQSIPYRSLCNDLPKLLWTTRLDALMWGILIFKFSRSALYWKLEPKFLRFWPAALAINAALIFALVQIPKGELGYWLGYAKMESQIALASAGLVLLASFQRGYVLPLFGWLKAVLEWIGARSYAIYLIHPPAFNVTHEVWFRFGSPPKDLMVYVAMALLVAVLTFGLAELNFRFVETPLRKRGVRIANRILAKKPVVRSGVVLVGSPSEILETASVAPASPTAPTRSS